MTPRGAKAAEAPPILGEVVEKMPQQQAMTVSQQQVTQLIGMLQQAITATDLDVARLERLWSMQKEIRAEQAKAEFILALSEMQSTIPAIKRTGEIKDSSGNVQSTYARWEHINEAIGPVLKRHGFALSFDVKQEGNAITITCVLSHRDGHERTTQVILAPDVSGKKNAPQAVVSAISYGKRTTASALLNITSYDEDDDGMRFGDRNTSDEEMAKVADFEAAILGSVDEIELNRVGGEIAKAKFPPRLRMRVRRAFAARLRELRNPSAPRDAEASDAGEGEVM